MPLTHGSFNIPGSHLLLPGKWQYPRQENTVFGQEGATVLAGPRTTRELVFDSWLFDSYSTNDELDNFLEDLAGQQGQVWTLTESNDVLTRSWDNVEFAGFEQTAGPFPPGGNISSSWFAIGRLHFVQLQP